MTTFLGIVHSLGRLQKFLLRKARVSSNIFVTSYDNVIMSGRWVSVRNDNQVITFG